MPREYSHTVLSALSECPGKGLKVIETPRYEKSGPSHQGQAGHAVAEQLTVHLWLEKIVGDQEFGEAVIADVVKNLSPDDAAGIRDHLMAFVAQDFPWVLEADEKPHWEERMFFATDGTRLMPDDVANFTHAVFAMTPDVWYTVNGGRRAVLRDYKFGWVPAHQKSPREYLQLRRYASALHWVLPETVEEVEIVLSHGRHLYEESTILLRSELSDIWHRNVKSDVENWESRHKSSGSFSLVLGPHCRNCDWRMSCSAWQQMPTDLADGMNTEDVVAMAHALDGKTKDLRAALVGTLEQSGKVILENHEAEMVPVTKVSFPDPLKVVKRLEEHLTHDQATLCLSVTSSSIKKALTKAGMVPKDRAELLKELVEVLGKKTVSTKLTIRTRHHERPEIEEA